MSKPCPYCGNNPVPHVFYWYNESLNIILTPLRQAILYNPLTRLLKRYKWDQKLLRGFLAVGRFLHIIKSQTKLANCKVQRAQVLWEEAEKRGIVMEELLLLNKPFDSYMARKVDSGLPTTNYPLPTIIFSGLPRPLGYTNPRLDLMDDKAWLKNILQKNNLPVPAGGAATSFEQAKKIFYSIQQLATCLPDRQARNSQLATPVIVKPRAGSRGRHSTIFVYTEADLYKAFKIAKQLCHWVMVERQLFGPVYRATVVNFELCGVLRGDPPQVLGDGVSSISQLISNKNHQPHPGVKDIVADNSMKIFLQRQIPNIKFQISNKFQNQNFQLPNNPLDYILEQNQTINLSEKIGVNYGGSSSEDFEICHPDNKALFVSAAKVLGDPIVGFDFIIPDIAESYKQQACGFIEVNSLPFINLHHDPLLGSPKNVAAKVWAMIGW